MTWLLLALCLLNLLGLAWFFLVLASVCGTLTVLMKHAREDDERIIKVCDAWHKTYNAVVDMSNIIRGFAGMPPIEKEEVR